jgi:signal transduction histidine kinase
MATVDVGKLIEKTAALRRHSLRARNVAVDLALREGTALAIGVPGQLMQVFLNLLINAEDACVAGGRTGGTVRIRVGSDERVVWATFQDDGPGIPTSELQRIFEPFFTTKGPRGGAGLGLSICKSIIEAHAGKIEVASALDGGAVFRVSFPRSNGSKTGSTTDGEAREALE